MKVTATQIVVIISMRIRGIGMAVKFAEARQIGMLGLIDRVEQLIKYRWSVEGTGVKFIIAENGHSW